ncbi:carotenoid oxygenase family protein [Spirillospora sp. NBC_01491]|uniref:carotenoid oxygenase family protein n=1 Tax=Spirillospora sp. NBC_01491 TaxID=2976007 RepID=UPI002E34A8F4|nr:carotenoid oxygenase family protein [Spirillospora sp. NBC_01491]
MTSSYLSGLLAPVPDEIDAHDLPVTGSLPPELDGRYVRNGPNPLPGRDPGHWFAGAGMIHGIRLRGGRAEWYRNRWVRTRELEGAPRRRADGSVDLAVSGANTHVIRHAGRILALEEGGLPYEMTPELDTTGPHDFDGRLTTAMTAHPKQDPITGELHFFGYDIRPPYLTYHRLSAAGELVESREVAVPGPTMMHDFAITENHVVWLDLPAVFDLSLLGKGMPIRWDDSYGARLGVMDRGGAVRWFEIDPCYVFHVGNAHEDASGRVVLDAVRYGAAAFNAIWGDIGGAVDPVQAASKTGLPQLHRWTLDPGTGTVKEERLDDRSMEFPTLNDAFVGRDGRYLYTVGDDAILKYDTASGTTLARELGADAGEAVFVPASGGRDEDDGWLLSIVSDRACAGSELLVLAASDLTEVARVRLPRRVPTGFHGSWITADGGATAPPA